MQYPTSIKNLIECFKKLPGIGEKTAERLALSILEFDNDTTKLFSESLLNVKTKIKRCRVCNNFCEDDLCEICKQPNRDKNTLCIVEEPKNVVIFEKVGTYNGLYHVLGGLISPLDGINPEDLNIMTIKNRIKDENIKEIIIAVKPSIEGETTALYISKILENENVKITKIAHGIPIGVDMEYIDSLTLEMALEARQDIS
jgi:recombination protein RecR